MYQEKLMMLMVMALRIMSKRPKLSLIDSESQFLVRPATISITPSTVIFLDTLDTVKIPSQPRLTQQVKPKLPLKRTTRKPWKT